MASAEHSFGVLSAELWSPQGLELARKAYSSFGRRGPARVRGQRARQRARLARRDVRVRARARAARALGAAHGPRARAGGLGLHDAGHRAAPSSSAACPCRRAAACASSRRSPRSCARAAASCARAPTSSACSSRAAAPRRPARGRRDASRPSRAVVASVTPQQLYGQLLRAGRGAAATAWEAAQALPLRPRGHADPPRARRAAAVGLARGRAARAHRHACTSRPASTASRAPSTRPSAGCCRPRRRSSSASPARSIPSRAPEGKSVIWIQLQELPRRPDRRCARRDRRRRRHLDARRCARPTRTASSGASARRSRTSSSATIKRVALSPADLEALNCNLVGGDIYAGLLRARPEPAVAADAGSCPGHATPLDGLWQIGASTHPGPGLGAGSGYLVAKQLLRPPLRPARASSAAAEAAGKLRERLPL